MGGGTGDIESRESGSVVSELLVELEWAVALVDGDSSEATAAAGMADVDADGAGSIGGHRVHFKSKHARCGMSGERLASAGFASEKVRMMRALSTAPRAHAYRNGV